MTNFYMLFLKLALNNSTTSSTSRLKISCLKELPSSTLVHTWSSLKKVLYLQNIAEELMNNYAVQMEIPLICLISSRRDTSMFKIIVSRIFLSLLKDYKWRYFRYPFLSQIYPFYVNEIVCIPKLWAIWLPSPFLLQQSKERFHFYKHPQYLNKLIHYKLSKKQIFYLQEENSYLCINE